MISFSLDAKILVCWLFYHPWKFTCTPWTLQSPILGKSTSVLTFFDTFSRFRCCLNDMFDDVGVCRMEEVACLDAYY
jgi:hypothetical protein